METGPAVVVREESTSNGLTMSTYCYLFATGQSFAQMEACKLISLVRTVSERVFVYYFVIYFALVQIVSGMEWVPARIRLFV